MGHCTKTRVVRINIINERFIKDLKKFNVKKNNLEWMLGNIKLCFVFGIHNLIDLMVDFCLCIAKWMGI